MKRGDKQNMKRALNRLNVMIPIASAAVVFSVLKGDNDGLYPHDPTGVMPSLITCRDTKSLDLNPKFGDTSVRVPAGTGQMLRDENFGVKGISDDVPINYGKMSFAVPVAEPGALPLTKASGHFASSTMGDFANNPKIIDKSRPPICGMPGDKQGIGCCAHRGVSNDFTTVASGQLKLIIVTIKTDKIAEGLFSIYHISETDGLDLYLVMRAITVNEEALAIAKLKYAFFPCMEKHRRAVIRAMSGNSSVVDLSSGLLPSPEDVLLDESVLPRMVHTFDGCGPEFNGAMRYHEDPEMIGQYPPMSSDLKNPNAGTALFQANDVMKAHQTFDENVALEKHVIREGEIGRLPPYMCRVDSILKGADLKPDERRSYFKYMANVVHWALDAFSYDSITTGY